MTYADNCRINCHRCFIRLGHEKAVLLVELADFLYRFESQGRGGIRDRYAQCADVLHIPGKQEWNTNDGFLGPLGRLSGNYQRPIRLFPQLTRDGFCVPDGKDYEVFEIDSPVWQRHRKVAADCVCWADVKFCFVGARGLTSSAEVRQREWYKVIEVYSPITCRYRICGGGEISQIKFHRARMCDDREMLLRIRDGIIEPEIGSGQHYSVISWFTD